MRALAVVLALAACGGAPKRPTVTGAELYEHVTALRDVGHAAVGAVDVRNDQVLTTHDGQTFVVSQIIDNCRGGDAGADVDCALALLLGQRFTVFDHAPDPKGPKPAGEDKSGSALTAITVTAVGVAAAGGLIYGLAVCEFPGCKAVFGVPLVLLGGAALFMVSRD